MRVQLWVTPLGNQKLTLQNTSRGVEHQEFCRCSAWWRYAINAAISQNKVACPDLIARIEKLRNLTRDWVKGG